MHAGVISLLISLASLQMFLNVAGAQVAVQSLAGIGGPQGSAAFSQLQQPSVPYPYPAYPPLYPQYPLVDDYYSPPTSLLSSVINYFKMIVWKVISVPLRILHVVKFLLYSLLGLGSADYGYGYPLSYPLGSSSSLF